MNQVGIKSNQDDDRSVLAEMASTPDPTDALLVELPATVISYKAMESTILTRLITMMKANE